MALGGSLLATLVQAGIPLIMAWIVDSAIRAILSTGPIRSLRGRFWGRQPGYSVRGYLGTCMLAGLLG